MQYSRPKTFEQRTTWSHRAATLMSMSDNSGAVSVELAHTHTQFLQCKYGHVFA